MRLIPDDKLVADKIPSIRSDWGQINRFGHSFDGYAVMGMDECARLANEATPTTLRELRAVLFFELRRWRNNGYDPDEKALAKFSWLLESIRQKVKDAPR